MRVFRVLFALTEAEVRRGAVPEAPGEALHDNRDGKDDADRRIAEIAEFAVADKNLIDDVIQSADQEGEDTRQGEFQEQFGNFRFAQFVFCVFGGNFLLTLSHKDSFSIYFRVFIREKLHENYEEQKKRGISSEILRPLLFDLGDFIIFFFVCQIKRRNRGKIFLFRTDNLPAGAPRHLNFFQECAILKENYVPVVVPRLAAALFSPRRSRRPLYKAHPPPSHFPPIFME